MSVCTPSLTLGPAPCPGRRAPVGGINTAPSPAALHSGLDNEKQQETVVGRRGRALSLLLPPYLAPPPIPPDPTPARQLYLSLGSGNMNPAPPSAPAPGCWAGASPSFPCSLDRRTTQNSSPILESPHLNCLREMASFQPPKSCRTLNLDLAYSAQSGQYFPQNRKPTSLVREHPSHGPALGQ